MNHDTYEQRVASAAKHTAFIEQENAKLKTERERLQWQIERFLEHCADPECMVCAGIICPHGDSLHFHHDGCPACDGGDSSMGIEAS